MTELAVVYRSVAELIPYARNARTHSDAQVAQIARSIREFGLTNPVLIDARHLDHAEPLRRERRRRRDYRRPRPGAC